MKTLLRCFAAHSLGASASVDLHVGLLATRWNSVARAWAPHPATGGNGTLRRTEGRRDGCNVKS